MHDYITKFRGKIHMWIFRTNKAMNGNKVINDYNALPEEIKKN